MRLIVARCSALYSGRLYSGRLYSGRLYSGRLDTVLPEALRLLMIKEDGSVLIHADSGGYKPLNWSFRSR